ncbi:MAG: LppU family putative lipoprotein, partial [Mycobacterium sp.]
SYSMRDAFSDSSNTACLNIDWVVGGCMNVDPANNTDPVRVDCNDKSVPHRQRAIAILKNLRDPVSVDQCASGVGYAYAQQRFAVCVEDMT